MAKCSIRDCANEGKYLSTGWCQTHYHRYWRTGSTELLPKSLRSDLTYRGAHSRVRATFGAATKYPCVRCENTADEWAYDGTDPTERNELIRGVYPVKYSVWPEFYMPMCFPCHRMFDARARALLRTEFGCGHPRTEENSYRPPSRPRAPECRVCRAEKARARYLRRKKVRAARYLEDPPARRVLREREDNGR